ncbi:hypothetical protein [Streptomyces sp. MUM 16J]|uniref:hypothetical protein n=1 Tax=Streptomyces sp. MUM 16J TaxID=2791988 RepID=UPI001F04C26A|nr:hypothetical protein [Streptomyces sp. MUM 16J]
MPRGAEPWGVRSGSWPPAKWPEERPSGEDARSAEVLGDGTGPRTPRVAGPAGRAGRRDPAAADTATSAGPDRRWRAATPRSGAVDPVKVLLHRHRELCRRAVDPLEIAAGLEAHGVTDRTAARFRHRDVFSLAEELYARVPRDADPRPETDPLPVPRVHAGWVLLTLLPGALGAATVAGLRLTHGHPRLLVALGGIFAAALSTRTALRRGPLAGSPATRARWVAGGAYACTCWLLGYVLLGDGLLRAALAGGSDGLPAGALHGPWPTATAPVLALALSCAPAAWCAHLLTVGARRRLAGSRGLEDFATAAKPLLFGAFVLFLGALTGLLLLCGAVLREPAAYPQALALGALLLLARLLTVHHHRYAAALALSAAVAVEAAALVLPLAGRLPGCAFLAVPVQTLTDSWGEAAMPTLACGAAALALFLHATRTLTRASAHAPTGAPE